MSINPAAIASDQAMVAAPQPCFTLELANRAVPLVARIVDDLTVVYGRIVELRRLIESGLDAETTEAYEDEYERAMDRLSELVDELELVGVEVRDFERGMVDFPARYRGREIRLTWELGDARVESWHEPDAELQPVMLLEG